jgi:hypothetical protein
VGDEVRLPATVPVVPRGGDASRRFVVEARLLDDTDTAISRVASEEGFVDGALREVTLTFPDEFPYDTQPVSVLEVADFETDGLGYVDIPGSELSVSPSSPDESWLVVVAAHMFANGSTGMLEGPGGIRVMVDGVERAVGEAIGWRGTSFQAVDVIRGGEATIRLQAKANTNRGTQIRDARIFSVRLPPFADLQVAERAGEVLVSGEAERVAELTFTPAAPGRYLILGNAAAGGRPGDRGVRVRVTTPTGSQWPMATDFTFPRVALVPNFIARVETLEAVEQTFAIEAMANTAESSGATILAPRLIAFRLDELVAAESLITTMETVARGTTPMDVQELEVPAATGGTQWLTLQSVVWTVTADQETPTEPPPSDWPNTEAIVVFERDDRVFDRPCHSYTGEMTTTSGFVDLVETDDGVVLRSTIASDYLVTSDPTGFLSPEAHAIEAISIALRF